MYPKIFIRKKGENMEKAANQSQGDRERNLWIASRKYLTGEINSEKLEEIESSYTKDFNNALMALSKQSVLRDQKKHKLTKKPINLCSNDRGEKDSKKIQF